MLTIRGRAQGRTCDGATRRDFLRIGGLALGGMSLPEILRAESQTGSKRRHKSIIMVFLPGGAPHQDMVDMKPDAPEAIRGEFKPIATNVPGIDICEHLPRLARMADKYSILRTIVGARGEHAAEQCLTGYPSVVSKAQGGRPSLGAILSYLQGPVDPAVPPFFGLSPSMGHPPWANNGNPGYLGLPHAPFTPNGDDLATLRPQGLTLDRLSGRRGLQGQMDDLRSDLDRTGALDGMDSFQRRAFEILSSSKLAHALDVTREDPRLRARYGIGDMNPVDDGGPCCMDHFLMARRLVEAGARCVTLGFGRWDYHSNNFGQCRERLPKLDMALSALIGDLHARGLQDDVTVICWGEFGRTPQINAQGGRDHWPQNNFAIVAGGGLRTGQVIGQTTKWAEVPKDRPISFQEVFATLYHTLGINPDTTVPDRGDRPMRLLDELEPIRELI
ncbi:DUF1501 domain-containing protein [Tundrisphaera lichenicola]|uniref:DUF1501 domain-containing protein n=1 Tax=Tundrisphaera lichenicola TaxID=2029860 RepID=UPI003EB91F25